MKSLGTRIVVGAALVVLLLLCSVVLPPIALTLVVSFFSALGAYELIKTTGNAMNRHMTVYPCMTAVAIPLSVYLGHYEFVLSASLVFLMVTLFSECIFTYGGKSPVTFAAVMASMFAGLFIPVGFASLVSMRMMNGLYVIMAFVITSVSDAMAYFVGVFLGKHRGVVKASPNKSVEGFFGSFFGGIVGILVFGVIIDKLLGIEVNYLLLVLYAALGNVTTQIGDLAFSVIKREHDIKDYGKIFPGHGGVLDRFDSTIFTGPLVLILITYFPAF